MIDFPTSPVTGDSYTYNGRTWRWDGVAWGRVINEGQVVSVLTRFGPVVQASVEPLSIISIDPLLINYI